MLPGHQSRATSVNAVNLGGGPVAGRLARSAGRHAVTETTALIGHVTNAEHQPDLEDNLFPVSTEVDVASLDVTGHLPSGLRGSFIRNGPNPMFQPIGRYHMFDGDGMLH